MKIDLPFDRADGALACPDTVPKCTQEHWGPALWLYLHRSALAEDPVIPPQRQQHILTFLQHLPDALPSTESCGCGDHFRNLLEIMPPALETRSAFFAWTVDAHNYVNHRLDKPVVSQEEALRLTRLPIRVCDGAQNSRCASPSAASTLLSYGAVAVAAGALTYLLVRASAPDNKS